MAKRLPNNSTSLLRYAAPSMVPWLGKAAGLELHQLGGRSPLAWQPRPRGFSALNYSRGFSNYKVSDTSDYVSNGTSVSMYDKLQGHGFRTRTLNILPI